jgi:parallel beta-helix repeat protein
MSRYLRLIDVNHINPTLRRLMGRAAQILMILMLTFSLIGMKSPTRVSAAGTTYYVDKTNPACSDATTGPQGTIDVPFCTLSRGAVKATAPGDIVRVIAGTYAETVYPGSSGTEGNPITFLANTGVIVTGQPGTDTVAYPAFALGSISYVVIDGFNIMQTSGKGILVDSSDHITIINNHVSYAGASSLFHPYEQGIYLKNTTNSIISNNITDHNTCIGIRLTNNSNNNLVSNNTSFSNFSVIESDAAGIEMTASSYNTILNNITYSNEDTGINLYANDSGVGSGHNLVIGNLSYENGDHGIDNYESPYNTIIGNTVHGNGTTGINLEGEVGLGSDHATVMNNIIAGNGFTPPFGSFGGNLRVDPNSIEGITLDYNLFDRQSAAFQIIWDDSSYVSLAAFHVVAPTQEVHGLEGDPRFVAPVPSVLRSSAPYVGTGVVGDYYLNPGSPAIDSANADAPSQPLTDIIGNAHVDDPATPNTGAGVRTYDDRGAYEYLPSGMSLPVATTQAVTAIMSTSATGNGNITALGVPNPTQHGVVWGTAANPTTANSKTTDGPIRVTGAFTSAITGLIPGTLYHVRAYATNAKGTGYGSDVTFTTLLPPTVTTQAVTNISTTTATGQGNVTALGVPNPTQHGVVWSTALNPTTADSKTTDGAVGTAGAFTSAITGLTPGMLYHVRAYATNTAATVYGEDVTFTALRAPMVTTQDVTNITQTSATGHGNVIVLGVPNPTEHGIVWGTSLNPTTTDNKTTAGPVSAIGAFTGSITGLTQGTLYHVRAYATNAVGTVYGDDVTFTTLVAPTVTTQAVTNITNTTATGNGIISPLGIPYPTQHGMVWSTMANPTTANSKTLDGPFTAPDAFASSITGLTPDTLYHVRAYATNTLATVYGEDVTFTTLVAPMVTTQAVTAVMATSATGNGNVVALGIPNPTQHGVVWSTTANPTTANSKTMDGPVNATGAFTSSMIGLTPGTLYHMRAYATNTAVTAYGDDVVFTTLVAPSVTTQAVTDIAPTSATGHGNVTALGTSNPTQHGVVWSTTANPTTANSKTLDGPVSGTGAFTSSITGLIPGTLYHVRAYVTSVAGTSYGADVTFRAFITPTITTQAVTNITSTSATGNGNITALGVPNPTQHGIVWNTNAYPTTANSKTMDGPVSGTGAFTSSMIGLTPGTLYHVRAYATNAAGTVYGEDVTFTTQVAPTVTTQAVSGIAATSATGNGNIIALGIPNPTQHGVVWALTANPTTANSKTLDGPVSATGAFTSHITGLAMGRLYHVRAYATNAAGTVYGEDVTFTSLSGTAFKYFLPLLVGPDTPSGN